MRTFTHYALACLVWFMGLPLLMAQPVDLGTASSFAAFTAVGAFSNDGNTVVTGDIGTNVGAFTGFPPGIVIGEIHVADVISAQAATDVALAYGVLSSMTCGEVLGTTLGSGQILTPNIYCLGGASTLNGNLNLDGQCDPDAVFIFQIDGAFSTTTLSTVTLINSASLCNVYWQVNGAVSLGSLSVFRGNIVAAGAISLLEAAVLEGRALTTAGAIDMHNNVVDMNQLPSASILVAEGAIEFCEGGSVILSGNCGGTWNNGETTATITVSESGDYFVTTENDCGIAVSNHIIVVVGPPASCAITGDLSICEGESTELCAGLGYSSYEWSTGEITACITVDIVGIYSVTVTDSVGCSSICNVTVVVGTPPVCTITGVLAICEGDSTELCAGLGFSSYLWSTGEITACITVNAAGTYSVTITDTSGCSSSCEVTVSVTLGNEPPLITCPLNIVIECDESTLPSNTGFATASDNCNNSLTVDFSDDVLAGSCLQAYTITRVWIATDGNGNTATCTQSISIEDSTPPTILCVAVVSPISCGSLPSFGSPSVTDACDGSVVVTFLDLTVSGLCPQEYSVIRTWIATDDCGNSAQCSATVVVEDNTSPIITCPVVVSPIECGSTPVFGPATAIDGCDGSVTVTSSDITVSGSCPQEYSVTRTWIATDDCGNSAQCSATVVVQDNTAPIITCAAVVSPIECGLTPTFGSPTVIDACDGSVTVTSSDITVSGSCPQEYSVTRTWIATDDCGNSAQCSATVVVQDNTAPVITCAAIVSPIECGLIPSFGAPTVIDACDGSVTVTSSDITVSGSCPQEYSVTRTWIATDDCGNSAQCSATIVVQDNTAPIITCAAVVSPIECGLTPSFGAPTVIDACDGSVTVTFSDITVPGSCPQEYSVTRTWIATDDCGNSAQCSATIVVQDNTAPIITCAAVVSPIECPLTPSFGAPTVIDACDGSVTVTFSDITVPGSCPQEYSVTRTWIATDDCGNSAQCSATIVVQDNTAPVITCPVVVSPIECDLTPSFGSPTVLDACDGSVTVTFSDITVPGSCPQEYSVTRTWTATDDCGNSAQCSATIVVQDTQPPVITLPESLDTGDTIIVQCYGQDPEWGLPEYSITSVEAIDACDGNIVVTFDQDLENEGDCEVDGYINLYRMIWTATDDCGNNSTAFVFLALVDTIAPVIFGIPGDVSIDCESIPEPPTLIYALDECLCACLVLYEETVYSDESGCQDNISVIRTWTATDRCGNQTVEQQTITLIDTSGPALQIIQSEIGNVANGTILEYTCNAGGIPAFFDTMGIGSILSIASCGGVGSISFANNATVTRNCEFFGYVEQRVFEWNAIDECGNESNFTLIIRLIDDEAPVFVGLPAMTCKGDPALDEVEAIDNCGNASIRFWETEIVNPCGLGAAIRRTYEAFDECGNMTRDTVLIIPNDLTLPIMGFVTQILKDLPGDDILVVSCNAQDGQYTSFGAHDVSIVDPCAAGITIEFAEHLISTGDCASGGGVAFLELIWTASDVCGNHSEQSILAEIIDTTGPVFINFKPVMTIGCHDAMPVSSATDNCGEILITTIDSIIPGNCVYEYDIIRQIIASDPCGNTTIAHQTIHVVGGGPTITGVMEILCDDLSIPIVTAFDACAEEFVDVVMEQDTIADPCYEGVVIRRTWSATDICGNTTVIQQIIVLNDQTPPVILIPSWSVINRFMDQNDNLIFFSQTDMINLLNRLDEHSVYLENECLDIEFTVDTLFAADCLLDGYAERRTYTWFVQDICGNVDSIYFIVDIMDDLPPVMKDTLTDTMYICVPLPLAPAMIANNPVQNVSVVFTELIEPGDTPGVFNVTRTWTATDSCQNSSTVVHHIIWIPESTIECNIILPETVECNSHGVIIGSDVIGGFGPYTYVWQVVGEKCFIQAGQGTPEIEIYVGWSPVKIILTITDSAGCVSMCMITLECIDPFESMSIAPAQGNTEDQLQSGDPVFHTIWNQDKNDQLEQIAIWPNPVKELLNLGFESAVEQEMQIAFVNLFGQVVLRTSYAAMKGNNVIPIDVSGLLNASYLMEIRTGTAVYTKMMVVLRNQ